MQRLLLILAVSLFVVGCANKPAGSAAVAGEEQKFSWEKDAQPAAPVDLTVPPEDAAQARVVAVNEEQGLIELVCSGDKPDVNSRLRIDKLGKLIDVAVLRHTEKTILVGIVPNQQNYARVYAGDVVVCGAIPPPQ
ncbi:MAG: hypothetical protein FJ410_04635 [Verrucomicrobia bacterium]|nr:hypothetical protein [Verrucomicrobiota bacterium]